MNILIYRAKRKHSNEYIEGYYCNESVHYEEEMHFIYENSKFRNGLMIDVTTLAIHFPDMLDSNGNKIFASLSEDGKGGDIMQDDEYIGIAKYIDCQFVVEYENCIDNIDNGNFDVIGIQE